LGLVFFVKNLQPGYGCRVSDGLPRHIAKARSTLLKPYVIPLVTMTVASNGMSRGNWLGHMSPV